MTTIRLATAADAPAIAGLLVQLGYTTAIDAIPARLSAIQEESGLVLVAQDSHERVVGLASGTRHATLHAGGQVAYITALVTAMEARGQGVGRALVEELERWAVKSGCVRLTVTSAEHRADAHAFYPKCGMPYTGRRFTKALVRD